MSQKKEGNGNSHRLVFGLSLIVGGYVLHEIYKKLTNKTGIITELYVYPIKSCKGTKVNKWEINKYGLKFDREWMIYNIDRNVFVTQRQVPKLALIKPIINVQNNIVSITLNAPNMEEITLNFDDSKENVEVNDISFFDKTLNGIDQGKAIQEWLTKYMDNKYKYGLVRLPPNHNRIVDTRFVPKNKTGVKYSGFSDEFPYLIISEETINDLNDKLTKNGKERISMNRFRPNIVITTNTKQPWIEDDILSMCNDDFQIYLTKPCSRCTIPTVNQETGIRDNTLTCEPTNTLRQFRTGKILKFGKKEWDKKVYVGMNAMSKQINGTLSVGDTFSLQFRKNKQDWNNKTL